ncbi:MAG: hypothetical protein PT956_05940 [Firmicutes bacterium]|nr:hypothetical protein [Bacillota bacterium]
MNSHKIKDFGSFVVGHQMFLTTHAKAFVEKQQSNPVSSTTILILYYIGV